MRNKELRGTYSRRYITYTYIGIHYIYLYWLYIFFLSDEDKTSAPIKYDPLVFMSIPS